MLSLAGCGGAGPRDVATPPPPDRLEGAEVFYAPAGCGMCPPSFRPTTYRFFADGRVDVVRGTDSSAVSGSYRLPSERVEELERRARDEGLAAGDSRRYYPERTSDLGEAELQVRLDGRLTARSYAETDGYHLVAFGSWLVRVVSDASAAAKADAPAGT
jgi:hypothetical protein